MPEPVRPEPAPASPGRAPTTTVRVPAWQRLLVRAGFPALGVAAGLVLGALLGPVLELGFLPAQDLVEVLRDQGAPVRLGVLGAVGLAAGAAVAVIGVREEVELDVTADGLEARHPGGRSAVPRERVALVCVDGRDLVILDDDGAERVRATADLTARALEPALRAQGFRFAPAHPRDADFRRWTDGAAALPASTHALLRSRDAAREKDAHRDAEVLRLDLTDVGVAVRDRRGHQEWCATATPGA